MKLSILDQSPVPSGLTEKDALEMTIRLAKHGEKLGYERFWIVEHHDLFGLACPNPSVMISAIGAQTERIRLGAGAVLLPYYQPFHIAETYNLLATLYPDRIDLGLGRAPGGSAEASLALSDNYLAKVKKYPDKIAELLAFFQGTFPEDHTFRSIKPTPTPPKTPDVWMLGTSEKSAQLAIEKGMKYTFGHFMTDQDGPKIVQKYRKGFKQHHPEQQPYVIVAIEAICAETTEKAYELARSSLVWNIKQEQEHDYLNVPTIEEAKFYQETEAEQQKMLKQKQRMMIGNPHQVRDQLALFHNKYQADEYMIVTIVPDEFAKQKSYELIKEIAHTM